MTNLSVDDEKDKRHEHDEDYEESDKSDAESEDEEEVNAQVLRTQLELFVKDIKRKAVRAELRVLIASLNDDQIFILCSFLQMPNTAKIPPANKAPSPDPVSQLNALTPVEEEILEFTFFSARNLSLKPFFCADS